MAQDKPDGAPSGARVIEQRAMPDSTVLVTFSLPGLRRMTIRVPWAEWTEGEHLAVGAQPHGWLDAV